jgi:cytochrome c biogenesis protein CcmG, thiol:disulfide interchange protein DsbE
MHTASRLAGFVIFAAASLGACQMASARVAVGRPAPALIAPEIDGSTFDLASLRGKVVVVNLWATWCAPCRKEMPELDAFYRKYHERGVEMIGMSTDRRDDRGEVLKIMKSFTYPAALLEEARVNGFGAPEVLPMTYVVDANGVLSATLWPGKTPVTETSLADVVLPLLSAAP